jgi:hypothetical protein
VCSSLSRSTWALRCWCTYTNTHLHFPLPQEDGVLELVSQHLGPPLLVQQSSTLFRRMNTSAMFDAVVGKRLPAGLQPVKEGPTASEREAGGVSSSGAESDAVCGEAGVGEGGVAADVEEGRGCGGGGGAGGGGVGESGASCAKGAAITACADAHTCVAGCFAGDAASARSEYIQLQIDIEQWVGAQREPPPRAHKGRSVAQQTKEPVVPDAIKRKLQRFAALKRELAQAACAQAGYHVVTPIDSGGADAACAQAGSHATPTGGSGRLAAGGRGGDGATSPVHSGGATVRLNDGKRGGYDQAPALGNSGTCRESDSIAADVTAIELHEIPESRNSNTPTHKCREESFQQECGEGNPRDEATMHEPRHEASMHEHTPSKPAGSLCTDPSKEAAAACAGQGAELSPDAHLGPSHAAAAAAADMAPPSDDATQPSGAVMDTASDSAPATNGALQPRGCPPAERLSGRDEQRREEPAADTGDGEGVGGGLSSLDAQSRAPAADSAAAEVEGGGAGMSGCGAGVRGGGTGLCSSSEGEGDLAEGPEGAEDKCWICYEGGPYLAQTYPGRHVNSSTALRQAWHFQRSEASLPWLAWHRQRS